MLSQLLVVAVVEVGAELGKRARIISFSASSGRLDSTRSSAEYNDNITIGSSEDEHDGKVFLQMQQ